MADFGKKLDMEAEAKNQSGNNKRNTCWMLVSGVLALVALGLLIAVIVLAKPETGTAASTPRASTATCNTPHCIVTAANLLQNIDPEVDPCDNFFEFACGGWLKRNIIPEDRAYYDRFIELRDDLQLVLKERFESEKSNDIEAVSKVKDFYSSCIDLETIEVRDAAPLIDLLTTLGGWPVLGTKPGGNWNESTYDFETLMAQISGQYNRDVIIGSGVKDDDGDTTQYVLFIDQPKLGMKSRDYFLKAENAEYKQAYFNYMVEVTKMLGVPHSTAMEEMRLVLEFETVLANLTVPDEERRDKEALYNPTTIRGLTVDYPQINWIKYFDKLMPAEIGPLLGTEEVINQSPSYIKNAARFAIKETPKRVVANYLIWRITMDMIPTLSQRFKDAAQAYINVLQGTSSEPARWRYCVDYVNSALAYATGRMYVEVNFAGDSKKKMETMIANFKTAFKDLLEYNDWMDEETKQSAKEKCDAIRDHIGYPDWIMEDFTLNEYYSKMSITPNAYFENVLSRKGWDARDNLLRLGETVDKDEWVTGPAVVNAFYRATSNKIVFPAAILQPPFYHADSPWYLNYGGIGIAIGHEITHLFDDRGRQYDKDGNLKQWWSEESIANFKDRAQCIVDQYGSYVMPENNKTLNGIKTQGENIADNGGLKQAFKLNGIKTQGENIADNGGLKQAFKAYMDNEYEDIRLPGFDDYTPEQLFYLSYAQLWCYAARKENVDSSILTDPHSPGRYRVIGAFHNSFDFPKLFNCRKGSFMNPPEADKCTVW